MTAALEAVPIFLDCVDDDPGSIVCGSVCYIVGVLVSDLVAETYGFCVVGCAGDMHGDLLVMVGACDSSSLHRVVVVMC